MTARGRSRRSGPWGAAIALSFCLLASPRTGAADKPFFAALIRGRDLVAVAFEGGHIRLLSLPDLATVGELETGGAGLDGVAVSGDGRWLAAAPRGGALELWDLDSRVRRFSIPAPSESDERSFLFHPQESSLLLFQDGRLELWDLERRAATETFRPIRGVHRMSISPDGRFLAVAGWCRTGCGDFGLCVLSLEEHLLLGGVYGAFEEGASYAVADLAYTPEHRIALTDADGRTRLFTAGTLRGGGVLPMAHRPLDAIRSAPRDQERDQSDDGEWMVTLSSEGSRLFLYRREPGEDPDRDFDLEKMVALP